MAGPRFEGDIPLWNAVNHGDISAVEVALEAGANVNGHPGQPYAPIVAAIFANHADIVTHLLKQGANPGKTVTIESISPSRAEVAQLFGVSALHVAVSVSNVRIIHSLLMSSSASINATDDKGRTPLMTSCMSECITIEVVRLLLEAGADPALADSNGIIPLHMVVSQSGSTALVDMLCSRAPSSVNHRAFNDKTPLYLACRVGHEGAVSKLLSQGAKQLALCTNIDVCPLAIAVENGHLGVVRVLMNEGGIPAVGGVMALPRAMQISIIRHRAIILRLLLTADGEEGRSKWVNVNYEGMCLLHCGAGFCNSIAVSILLEAGALEASRDAAGYIPRDIVGRYLPRGVRIDPAKAVAIGRMLQRGSAYRARSWAWPSLEYTDATDVAVAATAPAAVVRSVFPAVDIAPGIRVQMFLPKRTTSGKFFSTLIDR